MSKLVSDQIVEIGNRTDVLLEKIKSVLPSPIFDENMILRRMFGDEGSSPQKTLVLTYLRLEPLIRFLRNGTRPRC
jgi:hypothetical protein